MKNFFFGKSRRPVPSAGFTLIEMMIASVISLVALSAALGAGISLQRVNTEQQDLMNLQTSLTFVEKILTQEIERAGTGMSQIAVMAYNQEDSSKSQARLVITIENVGTADEPACTSNLCSRLTVYSGDIQNSLQVSTLSANSLVAIGSNSILNTWKDDTASTHLSNFLLVDPKSGVQCLFEDVGSTQLVKTESTSGGPGQLAVNNLINLTSGTISCDLSLFKSGSSFLMPVRASSFLTNGFTINQIRANTYIDPDTAQPRLMYIPNLYSAFYSPNGTRTWLTLSRDIEKLDLDYTIFDNTNPTSARKRVMATASEGNVAEIGRFAPTDFNSQNDVDDLISTYSLLPSSDSTANALMSMFNTTEHTEAFSIPLLRRLSQVEISLLLRKKCTDPDRSKCTSAANNLDTQGFQVRTITKRIAPNNILLISMNESIRG